MRTGSSGLLMLYCLLVQFACKVNELILRASSVDVPEDDCDGMYAVVPRNNSFHV